MATVTDDRLDDIKTKLERYRREREELDKLRQKFQGSRPQAKSQERLGVPSEMNKASAKENFQQQFEKRSFVNQTLEAHGNQRTVFF